MRYLEQITAAMQAGDRQTTRTGLSSLWDDLMRGAVEHVAQALADGSTPRLETNPST